METKTILSAEEIKRRLQDRNLTKVSKASGISRPTLYLMMKQGANPKYTTMEKISAYLLEH